MNLAPVTGHLQRSARHPLFPGVALAALGIGLIAGAYFFQYIVGLAPCPLCLKERTPWYVMIGLGIAIVAAKSTPAPRWLSIGLLAAALAVALWSAYLGGYHAGVEHKWWAGPASCTGGALPSDISLDNLSASEVVKCDVVPWEVFHISLAGFNFLFSLLAIGLAAFGLRGR